jgi:hypothetical protein
LYHSFLAPWTLSLTHAHGLAYQGIYQTDVSLSFLVGTGFRTLLAIIEELKSKPAKRVSDADANWANGLVKRVKGVNLGK